MPSDDPEPLAVVTTTLETHPYMDAPVVALPDTDDLDTGAACTVVVYPPDADVHIDSSNHVPNPGAGSTSSRSASSPPVSEGDLLDVVIDTLGDEGDGIATVDGFTVFVPGGEPGDELTVEVTTVKQRYAFATIRASGGSRAE